jgi:DHA1 family tetracycline resistance protein-like MFS transporter
LSVRQFRDVIGYGGGAARTDAFAHFHTGGGSFGEYRTLIGALIVAVAAMVLFGLASQGWMMYAVTAFYCAGLGLLNPSAQGLMSRSVPPTHQGLLQGATTSLMTLAMVVGPLLANGLFAVAISPSSPVSLPGVPFFVGSLLCLGALLLAARVGLSNQRDGSVNVETRAALTVPG